MGKYKKILLVVLTVSLLLVTVCLIPAAAASDTLSEVYYSNCRFYDLNFDSLSSTGEDIGNHDMSLLALGFFDDSYADNFYQTDEDGIGLTLRNSSTSSFGGSTTYFRTFFFKIDLPYSDDNQNFSMDLELYSNQSNSPVGYFDLGNNTFFRCGSKNAIITKNSNTSISILLNNVSDTTVVCQVSFLNTQSWRKVSLFFNNIKVRGTGTEQIIQNQNENTDKILNGGSDEPPYSAPDTSGTDEVHEKEAYIFENTTEGRDTAVSVFNNVGAVFNDSSFANGMLFVSSFFNEFFGISWLNSIGSVSLALGAFAFVIGSVVVIGRNVVSRRKGGD